MAEPTVAVEAQKDTVEPEKADAAEKAEGEKPEQKQQPDSSSTEGKEASNPEGAAAAPAKKPYDTLFAQLESLVKEAEYDEVYGVQLQPSGEHIPTQVIVQKFLRANANDVDKAKSQLLGTLKWRKEFQPLKAKDEAFSKERFGGLGYVIELKDDQVVTFNIYGGVKDNEKTFKDIPGFLRWRVGLMELGLSKLNLPLAGTPVPNYGEGPDPYQGIQVHDYMDVSFLRQNPYVKAASKEAIEVFQKHYPETLSRKFFINVPVVMGWVFTAVKMVLPKETVRKFTVLSYGDQLAGELGSGVPKVYGGEAEELEKIAVMMKME